jgi:polygalacturonase
MKNIPILTTHVYLLISILLSFPVFSLQASISDDPWEEVNEILARIVAPKFPDKDFIVTDFGAISDGQTDCRTNIMDAITACHKAGGGRVIVPAGDYLIEGPLLLKSNVNFHLQEGAYLKFGINPDDYLTGSPEFNGCVQVRWEEL